VAGVACFLAATSLKSALGYDDSLDAFGVHCIGGIVGALLTGVFASKEISGSEGSVLTQLWGVGTTLVYGFSVSFIILKVIDMTIGLRVTVAPKARNVSAARSLLASSLPQMTTFAPWRASPRA